VIGKTLSHYRIVAKLGAGGMGEVYRAEDTRLGRQVAIKVLPENVARDPRRIARFEQEARAVAALSHPNTLAIHDFGSEGGVTFAVTELLEGTTLREALAKGALPWRVAAEHARQIALGLAAAHDKGIVHRDLKPENVFVTSEGSVKILDFGLAKMEAGTQSDPERTPADRTDDDRGAAEGNVADRTVAGLTEPGTVLGTAPYMSPEQVRGLPVDSRSDLFALGAILHEMLTGESPFRRGSAADTMSAILRDEPGSLERVPALPGDLAHIVEDCLAKDHERRARSARDVALRLERCAEGGGAVRAPAVEEAMDSLAVLPFVNESGDEDVEYLSEGLTDALIENLTVIPGVRVMARSTVLRYRNAGPREVGTALGVRAVLTGSLRQRRESLLVRAELVDASDGRLLWGGRFERPVADLAALEGEICLSISEKLRFTLTGEERDRIARPRSDNPEAHQAYLKGRFVWNRWKTPEGMKMAIGFFERALDLDPLYARAFAGLADSYSVLGNVKALPPEEAYPAAKTAAQQGLAIDDTLAELHTSLGFIHRYWDWDWAAAEREFLRAIELNPAYATAPRWYAGLLAGHGRHDESIVFAKRALELEPLSLIIYTTVGDMFFFGRRYDEAMDYYRKAIELDPQLLPGHTDLARALELAGRYEEAIAEFRIAEALAPKGPPEPSSGLAHVYARMGRRTEALEILTQLKEMRAKRYVSPYGIASIHACLGDVDAAIEWLETAHAEHDQTLVWLKVHPRLDGLRADPRFQDLVRRMKL
jgi:serine/threonine protein kinase/tetratricopeptide (TPR) repeat protein